MAKTTKSKAEESAEQDPGFDERLEALEAIVAELERGELGLESAIERYGNGLELLKGCHSTLAKYRAQVQELGRSAEESLTPFAGDPDFAGDGEA